MASGLSFCLLPAGPASSQSFLWPHGTLSSVLFHFECLRAVLGMLPNAPQSSLSLPSRSAHLTRTLSTWPLATVECEDLNGCSGALEAGVHSGEERGSLR